MESLPSARDAFAGAAKLSADSADVTALQISSNKTRTNFGKDKLEYMDELKLDLVIFYALRTEARISSSLFALLH